MFDLQMYEHSLLHFDNYFKINSNTESIYYIITMF
jgi:hypothetical protein